MQKIPGRGQSAGLLEPEQANEFSRPRRYAETAHIPDPLLENTADVDVDEPFLRARQRVPVRRRRGSGFLSRFSWDSRWVRASAALIAVAALGLLAGAAYETRSLLLRDSHFFLTSTRNVQVTGNRVVTNPQVLAVFAPDIGHTMFRVPLAQRQAQVEQIRWVRRATVMRLWPNRLRVNVLERTPIAFARDGDTIRLVDDDGVLLDLPDAAAQHYSFPVLSGFSSGDPLSTREARIALYSQFTQALDAEGGHISSTLSEVDLSDPEDIRAVFSGPARQPRVHFGTSNFLPRYNAYSAHLAEWLRQYPQLRSVDMRYGRQVVLDTGTGGQASPISPDIAASDTTEKPIPTATADKPISTAHATKKSPPAHAAVGSKAVVSKNESSTAHSKKFAAKKHRATIHKKIHRHASPVRERGHPVRHPIMHVVDGA